MELDNSYLGDALLVQLIVSVISILIINFVLIMIEDRFKK